MAAELKGSGREVSQKMQKNIKKIKIIRKTNKGFTLVEMLVSISIFSMAMTIVAQLFFYSLSAEKRVAASVKHKKDLSWKRWGERLNDYIGTLEDILWLELIIIGGGISAKHDKFFKYVKSRAKMVPAEFLNEAGIVGAALWAEQERQR